MNFYNKNKDEIYIKTNNKFNRDDKIRRLFYNIGHSNSSLEDNIYKYLYNYLEKLDFNAGKIKIIICSRINEYGLRPAHESNIFQIPK